jgi:hypothetical protein
VAGTVAICLAFLMEKNRCDECGSPERKCNKNCTIRSCIERKGKYCFDCDSFPCKKLLQLDTRYRKNYGMSMSENLQTIKMCGIRNFIKSEKTRWTVQNAGEQSVFTRMVAIPVRIRKDKAFFF